MMSKYKDKAIPLVSVDHTGKYILTNEAMEFIRNVPGPIGVVSVAGLYRTGKSYLLNQMLLNRSSGFGVGPTINPCTKGLWCWGTPIKGQTADGQKLNIIVIDTQGIGALDEDQTHDTRIFTLAILASSCFIYNSVGSIDENAVQNLSLVVNLTKHIQLRQQKSYEDQDPDKISGYFPSFFWVVRDFSLQIADMQGNKMTSKQYLQRALAPQKGFSEDIEQKNKIRRMLTSFFKDRQCFTLVRPLIDQTKLQDLDKMNFDDLRPEFVSQVINFRKRVTGRMKPKTLNGQKLNGQLYLSMLQSYVGAINEGAVPNIQNAWNYMCQEQCTKVMSEALQTYQTQLRQIRIPCSSQQMTKGIEEAEEAAVQKFKKKSIGDDAQKYYRQLQAKMKERSKELRKINADEGKSAFKKYIAPFASSIQQKITKQQFTNFEDFLQELKKLQEKVTKEGPNFIDSNLHCQICINKILGQGVTYLFKRMKNQRQQIKKTLQQKVKISQNQIQSFKRQRESQQTRMKDKLDQLDRQKVQMTFKIEKMQVQLQRTAKERTMEGQSLSKNLATKKLQLQQIRKQFDIKITETNIKIENMTKNIIQQRSAWQKEQAIYKLKQRQSVQKIEELEKKLQNSSSKMVLETTQLTQKHRQQLQKSQEQLQQMTRNWAQSREKNERYEQRQIDLKQKLSQLTQKFEIIDRKLREETNSKMRQIQRLKNQHQSQLNKVRNEMFQHRDVSQQVSRQLEQKYRRQQIRAKQFAEQLKLVKNKYDKQNQILTQQLDFARKNYDQTKNKLAQTKTIYQDRIAAIEADTGLQKQEQVKRKIAQLKSTHQEQMRTIQNQYRQAKRNLTMQVQNLTKEKNELQLKLKVASEQLNNERRQNKQQKQQFNQQYKKLQNQLRELQKEKTTQLIKKDGLYNEKFSMLEAQLQQTRQNYRIQKQELQARFRDEITQIKNYRQMQSEQNTLRHNEEKDKLKKKYSKTVEDYERRLQQQTDNLKQQIERIQSEYENQVRALTSTCQELTHQKQILAKQKISLEQRFIGLNQKYNKMQYQLNQRLQKLIESSRTQKQILSKKLQQLQQNKNQMQKQLLSLTHQKDLFKNQSYKQVSQIEELKTFNTNLSQRFESTKSNLQERLKQLQEKYLKQKSKFETENALLQQKKTFAEQKIDQIQRDLKTLRERQQQQIKSIKDKYEQQLTAVSGKATTQKKVFQQKLQKIKKQAAQNQSTMLKQLSQFSKGKALDDQKIIYLQGKLFEVQTKSSSEISSLSDQNKALRQKLSAQTSQLRMKVSQLEQLVQNKSSQITSLNNRYELLYQLTQSKIKNLQQWGQKSINQKNQMIKSLEKQLDQSRRRNQNEKSNQQVNHQQILTRMQAKYRNQITQLSQDVLKRSQQADYLLREKQKLQGDFKQKLMVEKQLRISLQNKVTRLQNDFNQRQIRLNAQIDRLRAEKESQGFETQKLVAKQKQIAKNKIAQYQRKAIQADKLKQQAIFDKEKGQARWKINFNNQLAKLQQAKQLYERQKNENLRLMKQNQKLKAQRKKNTSFIKNQTTIMPRQVPTENKQNAQYQ